MMEAFGTTSILQICPTIKPHRDRLLPISGRWPPQYTIDKVDKAGRMHHPAFAYYLLNYPSQMQNFPPAPVQYLSIIYFERTFVKGDFEIWVLDFFNAKAGKDILIGRSYVDIDCIMYSLHKEKRVDEIINFLGLLHFFTERIL